MAQKFTHDCAIIGGGPGGLVSALYLRRFKRTVVLFDNKESRVRWIPKIRNLIGYADGISGQQLLNKLHRQLKPFKPDVVKETAQIFRKKNYFEIHAGQKKYLVKKIILATGMKDEQPPIENFADLCEKGVLAYCPICDGYEQSERKIAVLIDCDHGFRKVKFLTNFTKNLCVIALKKFKPSSVHVALIKKLNCKVRWGSLSRLSYQEKSGALVIRQKSHPPLKVDLAYVALGSHVVGSAIKHLHGLSRTREGYFKVNSQQETSVPGLYAVGDCVYALSQISVAVGHAAIASTNIHNVLSKNRRVH
ncbi:MAG: NAD(P)/FAD-dependent oxidoreductase [Bdellovibrionaceae bacterium]|nr:NAD(P)/FAD-dependent oxidoreductase [Bdellovibrio sp.]